LRFLDLSDNLIDKRSADYLAQAFCCPPSSVAEVMGTSDKKTSDMTDEASVDQLGRRGFNLSRASSMSEARKDEGSTVGLQTLRLDGCSLRPASLDVISTHSCMPDLRFPAHLICGPGYRLFPTPIEFEKPVHTEKQDKCNRCCRCRFDNT
jgi:hypothetical protein